MGKSVRNTSEGILGAIKTVTNKPASKIGENKASEPLPNVPKYQTLVSSSSAIAASDKVSPRSTDSASTDSRESNAPPRYQNPIEENNAKIEARKRNIETLTKKIEARTRKASSKAEKIEPPVEKPVKSSKVETEDHEASTRSRKDQSSTALKSGAVEIFDSIDLGVKPRNSLAEAIRNHISLNLAEVDVKDICQPDVSIVGPVFSALQYSYHQPQIVRLYGNLISTAMSVKTARFAHPGFVDLIRNITEDEARVLSWFFKQKVLPVIDIKKVITKTESEMRLNTLVSTIAQDAGCEYDDLAESYLANLERVGLLEIPRTVCLTDDSLYIRVLSIPAVQERLDALNGASKEYYGEVLRYYAKLSVFGIRFCHACIR